MSIKVQELLAKKYAKHKVADISLNEKAIEYKVELEKGLRTGSLVSAIESKGLIYS